jgi:sugar phosphate permease
LGHNFKTSSREKEDEMRRIPYRWIIAVILFFCYSIQYLDRVKTAVLNPAIMKDIGLTASGVGTGAMLMMLFYGPAQYILRSGGFLLY